MSHCFFWHLSQHKEGRKTPGRQCNFWLGGPILTIWDPKQVLRQQGAILHFSQMLIGLHFDLVFVKNWFKQYAFWITDQTYIFLSHCFFWHLSQHKWGRFSQTISLLLQSARHTSVASPRCARLGIKLPLTPCKQKLADYVLHN